MLDGYFRLFIVEDNGTAYEKDFDQDIVTIGRSSEATLVILLSGISRIHAKISRENGHFFVEDNGSTNRTFLNDVAIIEKTRLSDGDVIKLGKSVTLSFRIQQVTSPEVSPSPFEPVTLQDIPLEPSVAFSAPREEEDLSWLDDEDADTPQITDATPSNINNIIGASGYDTEVVLPISAASNDDDEEDMLPLEEKADAFNPFAKNPAPPTVKAAQSNEQTPLTPMPAVANRPTTERPITTSTRPVTLTTAAKRDYCLGCITLLTPEDTRTGFNTFVQCDRCGKIYHEACWSGTCVRFSCGATSAHPVNVTMPAPLVITEKQRSILPEGKIYSASVIPPQPTGGSPASVSTPPKAPSSVPKPPEDAQKVVVPKPPQATSSPAATPNVVRKSGPSAVGDMAHLIRAWFWRIVFFLVIVLGSQTIAYASASVGKLSLLEAFNEGLKRLSRPDLDFVREVILPTVLVMWVFYPRQLMGMNTSQSLGRRLMRIVGVAMAIVLITGFNKLNTGDFFEVIQSIYQDNRSITTLQAAIVVLTLVSIPIYRRLSGHRADDIEIPDSLNWVAGVFSFVRFYAVAAVVMLLALGVAYEALGLLTNPAVQRIIIDRNEVTLPVINAEVPISIFLIAAGIALSALLIYHPPARNRYTNSHWWLRVLAGVGVAALAFLMVQQVNQVEFGINGIASLMLVGAGSVLALLPIQRTFS